MLFRALIRVLERQEERSAQSVTQIMTFTHFITENLRSGGLSIPTS